MLSVLSAGTTTANTAKVELATSLTSLDLHILANNSDGNPEEPMTINGEGVVFLKTGDILRIRTNGNDATAAVAAWPIADVNGNFINPDGFSFE